MRKREIEKIEKYIKEQEERISELTRQQRWMLNILKKRFQTLGSTE